MLNQFLTGFTATTAAYQLGAFAGGVLLCAAIAVIVCAIICVVIFIFCMMLDFLDFILSRAYGVHF